MKDKRKEKVFIGEQNYWAIHDFIYHNRKDRLQGVKLEALFRLIQSKGKIIDCRPDQSFYGIKVLEYTDDDFIGFIRTGMSKTAFFPCKLQTIVLRDFGIGGKNESTTRQLEKLKEQLKKEKPKYLYHDMLLTPSWIANIFGSLLNYHYERLFSLQRLYTNSEKPLGCVFLTYSILNSSDR